MAYLLICVRTEDTIVERAVFSKDLAPVKFDTSEMGLAFRHDPCTNSAQYFVIHSLTKPSVLPRNQMDSRKSGKESAIKDSDDEGTRESIDSKAGTSLTESAASSACTCSNGGSVENNCKFCDTRIIPKFSLVLLDVKYKIVTKLKSDVAYTSFREVVRSREFREGFINFIRKKNKTKNVSRKVCTCENVYKACDLSVSLPRLLEVHLEPAPAEICYAWNQKVGVLVQKRMILEETMAWLSTLGGGYSSLGDYFRHFSEEAGKISMSQLHIAMEMGDPIMAAKCRLFFALSLMQRGQLHQTKIFIRDQYYFATHFKVRDQRLIDMCKGMWSKLQYLYAQKHREKLTTATHLDHHDNKETGKLGELEDSLCENLQEHSQKLSTVSSVMLLTDSVQLASTTIGHHDNKNACKAFEVEDT